MHDFNLNVRILMQRISYDIDVSAEDPLLIAAARILLNEYIPNMSRPNKVYVAPHIPGKFPSSNGLSHKIPC